MEQGQGQEQGLGQWRRLDDEKIVFQHVQSGFFALEGSFLTGMQHFFSTRSAF